jgi:hypothetical protein
VVRLVFPAADAHTIDVRAEVVWVNAKEPQRAEALPPGIGLRFLDLKDADRAALEHIVAEHDALPRKAL